MADIIEKLHAAVGIHETVADELAGITCRCKKCGRASRPTEEQIAGFLRNGWPTCCGETVYVDGRAQPEE